MVDAGLEPPSDRARVGWWLFVVVLALVAAFIAYSFVGMLALGVFGYYATRPIYRRFATVTDSDGLVAGLTILVVLLPVILLTLYAGFQVVHQVQQLLGNSSTPSLVGEYFGALSSEQRRSLVSAIENPRQFVTNPSQTGQTLLDVGLKASSALFGGLLLVSLSVTLSFFLLKNDDDIRDGLVRLFGGRDTTAYAYALAVDEDLESVFFGNFLFVAVMSVVAAVTYTATNFVAPGDLHVPMVFVLAFLTGVASLVPIVVGKIVYLPVVAFLGVQAAGSGGASLAFVGIVLVVYFLVLDILPQTFLQPYITGRQLDMVVMMFAYLLGPILFGWYGFFLLPILFVLILEVLRIVLPQLLHGEPLTPTVSMGESVGSDPESVRDDRRHDDRRAPNDGSDDDSDGASDDTASGRDAPSDDASTSGDAPRDDTPTSTE